MRLSISTIAAAVIICLFTQQVSAQTLQLPTFQFFSVSTTVSVPDSGGAFLGGINRAASGGNQFGVPGLAFPGFQNRSFGQDMSASNVWATATIHDFDAMDQAILNSPSSGDFANLGTSRLNTNFDLPAVPSLVQAVHHDAVNLAGNWRTEPSASPTATVASEEADRDARRAKRSSDADNYFARGQQAEADGKPSVARIYYQMAVRRSSGDFKQQVQARLDALSGRNSAVANNAQ
jgi:hypothetical protein